MGKIGKLLLPAGDRDLLNCYIREYEIINKMFVEPVWLKLREYKQFKQRSVKGSREKNRINNIKRFLEENNELRKLSFLLLQMNTDFRNAIVHLSYYMDTEKKAVIFFYEEDGQVLEDTILLKDLEDMVLYLIAQRVIILVIMGQ